MHNESLPFSPQLSEILGPSRFAAKFNHDRESSKKRDVGGEAPPESVGFKGVIFSKYRPQVFSQFGSAPQNRQFCEFGQVFLEFRSSHTPHEEAELAEDSFSPTNNKFAHSFLFSQKRHDA
jgi:hypothetical protein